MMQTCQYFHQNRIIFIMKKSFNSLIILIIFYLLKYSFETLINRLPSFSNYSYNRIQLGNSEFA